ncbi:hypothetical protein [Oscillatoria salina]|uniref:hypothetical protein n=1 Tax=Oscillatoria salina TaxID=331517 RepID=UPI0013BA730F|nr:hypothetical protein [Oscillatoria salina]MBZ8179469.1 hypothetical protein [Oscillatoria salina IIICB1]NET89090.1 hypothetical protein [Kamptonema sp. SIO1D9]
MQVSGNDRAFSNKAKLNQHPPNDLLAENELALDENFATIGFNRCLLFAAIAIATPDPSIYFTF